MQAIRTFMAGLHPLLPGAGTEARIIRTSQANFLQKWKTPHALAIFAEDCDDALINVGFMYQQLDLYMQSLGLGSCWVGLGWLADGEPVPEGMRLAILLPFGNPAGVPLRETSADFKRKALHEITDVPDVRLEVVRIAPSATNSQPWYFTHEADVIHVWREELGRIKQRTLGKMNPIDMGIALAHLYTANPERFVFSRWQEPPVREGYIYVGSVKL